MQRPIFLSRHIRCTPKIKIPTIADVQEAITVVRTMPIRQDRIDYCNSVSINYENIEKYYDTVVILEEHYNLTPTHTALQVFVDECMNSFWKA